MTLLLDALHSDGVGPDLYSHTNLKLDRVARAKGAVWSSITSPVRHGKFPRTLTPLSPRIVSQPMNVETRMGRLLESQTRLRRSSHKQEWN